MATQTNSEKLFAQFCSVNRIRCEPVLTGAERTPDFQIRLADTQVICEVKQIDPNDEDINEWEGRGSPETGRFIPNRMRKKLKDSAQLKAASDAGRPTLLVVYDNTPVKAYTDYLDVVQAMFGQDSVKITDTGDDVVASAPFFDGNRGLTPTQNTSVSAIAILEGDPAAGMALRIYHNPYARVVLEARLFADLPMTHFPSAASNAGFRV